VADVGLTWISVAFDTNKRSHDRTDSIVGSIGNLAYLAPLRRTWCPLQFASENKDVLGGTCSDFAFSSVVHYSVAAIQSLVLDLATLIFAVSA
jgi:hypothetical protein